jgi:exopolysaccharide biosynthesis protein
MKKFNHKGFTMVEFLLVVIAFCLVVGVGYYIYNSNHNKNSQSSISNTSSTNSSKSTATSTSKQYLNVKELGIKFELTSKLKNAYYAKVGNYYYLSVHDFDSNPELIGCSVNSANNTLGILAISVGKVGENNGTPGGDAWTQATLDASGMKKVGDSYYGFQSSNAPCFDPTGANSQTNAQTVSDFKHAFIEQQSTITKL